MFNIENFDQILNSLKPHQASLVAVSKKKPVEIILEAYNAGQKIFGENYVQEMNEKREKLPKDIEWHFIGHLQSNKVKQIAPFVSLVQSVDSLKLLKEINKEARKNSRVIDCLLQIHIATEETKYGLSYEEAENLLLSEDFMSLKNIHIKGLMGMATLTDDVIQVRCEYKKLKTFYDRIISINQFPIINFQFLSMGMTSDYHIALEEGSNMVRIGSAIFGERSLK